MDYDGQMVLDPQKEGLSEKVARLEALAGQQEARLATYKETLDEIYALYDGQVEELSFIRRLSDRLRIGLDLKKVCLAVVQTIMEELGPDGCLLLLAGREGGLKLKASASQDRPAAFWPDKDPIQSQAPQGREGPFGRVALSGLPVLLGEMEEGQGLLAGIRSMMVMPLISRQETVGVLALLSHTPGGFAEKELRVLTITCDQAAAVLSGVRLINEVRRVGRAARRSERKARRALESWERLLENANDLILTLDGEGRITYANRLVRDLGLEPERLLGSGLSALVGPKAAAHLLRGRGGPVEELTLTGLSGPERTALLSLTPLPAGDKDEQAWLVIARDVTQRKQLERQLLHSEKLASVGLLAAGVAHEIGNPLSAIGGYAQILKKKGLAEEARAEFLGAIEEQVGRIEKIIQELLAYSRPSSGARSLLSLNEVCQSLTGMLTNQNLFRGVEVVCQLDPGDPKVVMDRDHLTQILINLLVNAAQSLEGRGTITLSTRASGRQAVLRVADDGPGIPAQAADRIFDPFFTTKPVGQGTGLGLSICHRIVEGESGSIRLVGPGPGAVFEVVLPAFQEEAEAEAS